MARTSKYAAKAKDTAKRSALLAGVYARLSIEDSDSEEQNSIGNQKMIAQHYAESRTDLTITEFYADNGYTGMNFNRPDFQRMMNDLQLGKINCVIVKDISRLGRHFIMTSELVEKIFPAMGIRLICVNDDYDSADASSDSLSLLMPFRMIMNDSFVRDISRKIRSSIYSKMDSGKYLPASGSIPYGYLRNPQQNTFDIDEETAPIVRRIFEMRAMSISQTSIAKILNLEEVPCPGRLRYLRGITTAEKYREALWVPGTLRKILRDPVYIGCRVHGKEKRDRLGMCKTERSPDQWQIIENAHPAIVSQELFHQVEAVGNQTKERRQSFQSLSTPGEDDRDLLRDKVYCGDCGNLMRGCKGLNRPNRVTGERKAFIYYDCGKYLDSGRLACKSHYIRQEQLMSALTNALNQQLKIAVDLEALLKEVQTMPKVVQHQSEAKARLTGIQARHRHMDKNLEQLLTDLATGLIDRDEYQYAKARHNREREALRAEEEQARLEISRLDTILSSSGKWISTLRKFHQYPVIDRKLLDQLVERILIYPGHRLEIQFRYQDPCKAVTDYLQTVPEVREHAG